MRVVTAADHLQSEFEDWDLPRAHKTKSVEEGIGYVYILIFKS